MQLLLRLLYGLAGLLQHSDGLRLCSDNIVHRHAQQTQGWHHAHDQLWVVHRRQGSIVEQGTRLDHGSLPSWEYCHCRQTCLLQTCLLQT